MIIFFIPCDQFSQKRLNFMSNYSYYVLFLVHWLRTGPLLSCYPQQRKVQYYYDASDWSSSQIQNCSKNWEEEVTHMFENCAKNTNS